MKKSELLQLAIDNHLAMTLEEHKPFGVIVKPKFLCYAVHSAGDETYNTELAITVRKLITASIDNYMHYTAFLYYTRGINCYDAEDDTAKFAFIQFMRRKRAEHIIEQLQERGE